MEFKELYDESYFTGRLHNDPKRLKSFLQENIFLQEFVKDGNILDVGCSTGEFLLSIDWKGHLYGMEISEHAKEIACKNGIDFSKDLTNTKNFFDVIVFRGTIQHIDQPFTYLQSAFEALREGGYLFFLATPNINSPYFKIWNTLPALNPKYNFYLPSNENLRAICENYGFKYITTEFPYLKSPYANPFQDHLKFAFKLMTGSKNLKFPFWKSMMNLAFQKPKL